MREGGREGTGSKPWTRRREVPTRALKALPNTLLATRGDPKVMHRMSASGYSSAAHAAPATHNYILYICHKLWLIAHSCMLWLQSREVDKRQRWREESQAEGCQLNSGVL